ncbi:hypothetical protein BXY58_0616 [Epilithonimonas arachidiradicis]|uniref:Uncharacterized protein n=2 Tax=Epilithonimonas arachidiradicis TaxID=1617282 RepID=A0A420DDR9_9FLAO|nr:hypothetical protein BXY58_0616 [Epilithonimonas arachidiradicis]GGG47212.1 hypothetical protein GCM10007332_05890 [Epilithonimonas arachidiradicis]
MPPEQVKKKVFNELVKLERNMSVADSIINSPLIATQGKKINVVSQIIRIIEFFLEITGKELEGYQIQVLAGDIYEKFKTDSLEDVVLMFKMARQGEFGKVYKCDTFEIMDWANKYLDYKSATRERLILKKKKKQEPEVITGKSFHELPKELQEKFSKIGKSRLITRKASDMMTTEKTLRDLEKPKEKQEVLKTEKSEALFSYEAFLKNLSETVGKMYDEALHKAFENTTQSTHPEVWEILNTEIELRKTQKELNDKSNRKTARSSKDGNKNAHPTN